MSKLSPKDYEYRRDVGSVTSKTLLGKICNVSDTTIMRWRTSAGVSVKNAETFTNTGMKTSALYDEKAILKALAKYNGQIVWPNLLHRARDLYMRRG